MQENTNSIRLLVEELQELRDLHEQLLLAVRNKQKCMRGGDVDALESWSARERFLIERIKESDEHRRGIVDELAEQLDMDQPTTVTELAGRVEEPDRSRLLAMSGVIRGLAEQIHRVNQINDAVTREILQCFTKMRHKFTASQCDIGLYDTRGQRQFTAAVSVLDAVG